MQQPQTDSQCERTTEPAPVLILGVGNILLRDEGVGVRVVEALLQEELPAGVEAFDGATVGFDLLEVLAHRRKVVVVDAIAGDQPPGTVLRLRPEDLLPQERADVSLHEMGLLEALSLAQLLKIAPQEVVIIGVKPEELSCGLDLSPRIAELVPALVELALTEARA